MPKFYFHIRSAFALHKDLEGAEYGSSALARQGAISAVRELLAESIARGPTIDGRSVEIADEHGRVVEILPFNEAIRRG